MQQIKFGKTGERISRISFGAMRIPILERNGTFVLDEEKSGALFEHAHAMGINYFDTAAYYAKDLSEIAVGKGVEKFRSKVLLATKLHLKEGEDNPDGFKRRLELSLERLRTDTIDFYQLWSFGRGAYDGFFLGKGIRDCLLKAKEQGLIRHLCFSFHGNPDDLPYILEQCDLFESILVNHNIYDRSRENQLAMAAAKGLGLVNMGALSSPGLVEDPSFREKARALGLNPYEVALKFVLQVPHFHSVLSSFKRTEDIDRAVAVVDAQEPLTEVEKQVIEGIEQHPTR